MEKNEISKYAGSQIYALCRRMGGIRRDIDCLTVYEIQPNGALHYKCEVMPCVANKTQWREMLNMTKGHYVVGRPTAAKIEISEIETLIS